MKQIITIDGRYWCPQCGHYYDYDEMANVNTCRECVKQLREVQMVELKKLLKSMPDEDIEQVDDEIEEELHDEIEKEVEKEVEKEYYEGFAYNGGLRDEIIDEIKEFHLGGGSYKALADKIIKLIKQL